MTKLEDLIPLLDMYEEVCIYASCNEKAMIFHGMLRDFPLETYLGAKDMNVTCMYPAVEEGGGMKIIVFLRHTLTLLWGGNYD